MDAFRAVALWRELLYATHNDLSISTRETIVALLQAHLVDCVDLFTQVKQAQWNVKGPHALVFRHMFGGIAQLAERHSDMLATRIVGLGGRAEASARVVAARSTMTELQPDTDEGLIYVAVVAEKVSLFGKGLRASIARAAKCEDAVTAELFTRMACASDRYLQILDAHLQAES